MELVRKWRPRLQLSHRIVVHVRKMVGRSLLSRAVGETEVLELLMRTALDGWPSKQI